LELERRNFLRLGLAGVGAVGLSTQGLGIQAASAVTITPLKGIGYSDKVRLDPNNPAFTIDGWKRIQSLNPQWWYNWNQRRFDGVGDTLGSKFVPMLWSDSPTRLASLEADLASCNMPTRVLGFNEPDLDSQANMTTGEARRAWRALEKAAAVENLKIGSPVTISPNAWWMDRFMTDATELEDPDLKIDFVTCHIYQNPDVATFLRKIDTLHDRWGKDVWVTETAVADFNATPGIGTAKSTRYTRAQVNQYMVDLWPELKKRPWLLRFAWKTRNVNDNQMWFSSLFNDDGSLTSTGIKYRDLA
jgi:hypothetical protein